MKPKKKRSFDSIVRRYHAMRSKKPDTLMEHCMAQSDLVAAIDVAARALDAKGRKHSHQKLVKEIYLRQFANLLKTKEVEIKKATSFDELMAIVKSVKFRGIGELAIYDTATRIGAYLNLFPDKIYLHRGTREGALALCGIRGKKECLTIEEMPQGLKKHGLSAAEFEDILCIFKDEFKTFIFY